MSEFNGIIVNLERTSARVDYLFHWLLNDYTEWRYSLSGEKFTNPEKVLNYSPVNVPGALNIIPTEWMFEEQVRMPKYQWAEDTYPRLLLEDKESFDAISAIFFMISRVEEYTPSLIDLHGRYPSTAATNRQYLLLPLADLWRQEIHHLLGINSIRRKNSVHFSFDIDSAYAYKHKGFMRTTGAICRDFISFKYRHLAERILCITGIAKDPFDTYDYIIKECQTRAIELSWFFLLSNRTFENNNIRHTSKGLRKLITRLASKYTVGIHPGYDTWRDMRLMQDEVSRLNEILSVPVHHSRQHYLRFALPETYRIVLENGIRNEYSMGYADAPGFRAGTSMPFAWFDMSTNKVTDLVVHPFCAMDVTFSRYQKISADETISVLKILITQIELTRGKFHMLWHNETLSNRGDWDGWKKLWCQVLNSLTPSELH